MTRAELCEAVATLAILTAAGWLWWVITP